MKSQVHMTRTLVEEARSNGLLAQWQQEKRSPDNWLLLRNNIPELPFQVPIDQQPGNINQFFEVISSGHFKIGERAVSTVLSAVTRSYEQAICDYFSSPKVALLKLKSYRLEQPKGFMKNLIRIASEIIPPSAERWNVNEKLRYNTLSAVMSRPVSLGTNYLFTVFWFEMAIEGKVIRWWLHAAEVVTLAWTIQTEGLHTQSHSVDDFTATLIDLWNKSVSQHTSDDNEGLVPSASVQSLIDIHENTNATSAPSGAGYDIQSLIEAEQSHVALPDTRRQSSGFCAHCGTRLVPDGKFCSECGKPVTRG